MQRDFISGVIFIALRVAICLVVGVFLLLIGFIFIKGVAYLSPKLFAWEYTSTNVSMMPSIINTISMVILSLTLAIPFGIFGAIFLNEYGKKQSLTKRTITLAVESLAGIPSIVYGLFGFLVFVKMLGLGYSLISGSLTLSIMILPLILTSTKEALQSVPKSLREASFALGARESRTIFGVVLPAAMSGILAGIILSIGKIIGESAALLYTSASVAKVAGLLDSARTLSVHMYVISSEGLHIDEAYSTAMILILIVLFINTIANLIAKKLTKGTLNG